MLLSEHSLTRDASPIEHLSGQELHRSVLVLTTARFLESDHLNAGSSVYWLRQHGEHDASKTDQPLAWTHHVPGRAFINNCQHFHGTNGIASGQRHAVVVRGFSSAFRRSPAEGFADSCLA